MRRLLGTVLVLVVLLATVGAAKVRNHSEQASGPVVGVGLVDSGELDTVARIHDGDTFYTAHHPEGVRIIGAGTPEVSNNSHGNVGCWGDAATVRLRQLIPETGPVILQPGKGTSHGRLLASVETVGHVDVAAILIREGLAEALIVKPNVEHAADYERLETEAQRDRLGVWSGTNPPGAPAGCVNPPPPEGATR